MSQLRPIRDLCIYLFKAVQFWKKFPDYNPCNSKQGFIKMIISTHGKIFYQGTEALGDRGGRLLCCTPYLHTMQKVENKVGENGEGVTNPSPLDMYQSNEPYGDDNVNF